MHDAIKEIIKQSPHLKWLETNTLILGKAGSKSYGTSISGSDDDFKFCFCEPAEYTLGILNNCENIILNKPYDCAGFSLKKFLQLAINNNPNCLELLFIEPEDYIYVSPLGQKLIDNRNAFLSKKLKFTLSGYAISQLNRIKLHKSFIDKGAPAKPNRSDYGLPERSVRDKNQVEAVLATIDKEMRSINFDFMDHLEDSVKIEVKRCMKEMFIKANLSKEDQFLGIGRDLGINDSFMAVLQKEKEYFSAVKAYDNYFDWKKNRNPARAELEEKYGMDCKHASHLIRLCNTAKEVLTTGKYLVRRPDAEFLKSIRQGAWTYEQVIEFAHNSEQELNDLYEKCTILPREPDRKLIDKLCIEIYREFI